MERNVAEYLVHLKNNASELRKLGKEWGMSEEEIDECVNEALAGMDSTENLKNSPKNVARRCFGYFLVAMKILFAISVVIVCLLGVGYVLVCNHEPTRDVVSKFLYPYSYQIMRMARLVAVPLHDMFNITDLYSEECLVGNPFFIETSPDCNLCSSFKTVKDRNTSNFTAEKFDAYAATMKPVKFLKVLDRNITYRDLRDMYVGLNGDLQNEDHQFVNVGDEHMSLNDFFVTDREELVNSSDTLQVRWITRTVKASAALRKLFPRPSVIPLEHEVILEKVVLIDGPNSTTHKVPDLAGGDVHLFIMGSGRRRALVRPVDGCKEICSSLLVFMNPGEALMYNANMWKVYLGNNNDVPMVGYLLQLRF